MEIKPLRGQRSAQWRAALSASHLPSPAAASEASREASIQLSDNLAWLQVSIPDPAGLISRHSEDKLMFSLCINWYLTPHIPSSSSSSLGSTFPSLSAFFHSLCCQEFNDTAELAHCYGNRFVIGRVDWGRVGHGVLGGDMKCWVGGDMKCWVVGGEVVVCQSFYPFSCYLLIHCLCLWFDTTVIHWRSFFRLWKATAEKRASTPLTGEPIYVEHSNIHNVNSYMATYFWSWEHTMHIS